MNDETDLNDPEFLEWLRGYDTAVGIIAGVFREAGLTAGNADHNARACLARLAQHVPPLTVDWLKP